MARQLIAGLAPGIVVSTGYQVNIVALDPTTGAPVTGVVVSDVAMQVNSVDDGGGSPELPDLLPVYVAGADQ